MVTLFLTHTKCQSSSDMTKILHMQLFVINMQTSLCKMALIGKKGGGWVSFDQNVTV